MRILAISDIHLNIESANCEYTSRKFVEDLLSIDKNSFDVLVFAGDIANKSRTTIMFLKKVCEAFIDKWVIFVPGNHDFYNRLGYYKEIDKIKNKLNTYRFVILYDSIFSFNNYNFIGTTLWTNMQYGGNIKANKSIAAYTMNDYYKILKDDRTKLLVDDTINMNKHSFNIINQSNDEFYDNIIVITHHAPSPRSIPAKYMNCDTNAAYVNEYDDFIRKNDYKIKLWIHGHIHAYNDYQIGNTRIFSNPLGYGFDDERKNFEFKIIEV